MEEKKPPSFIKASLWNSFHLFIKDQFTSGKADLVFGCGGAFSAQRWHLIGVLIGVCVCVLVCVLLLLLAGLFPHSKIKVFKIPSDACTSNA